MYVYFVCSFVCLCLSVCYVCLSVCFLFVCFCLFVCLFVCLKDIPYCLCFGFLSGLSLFFPLLLNQLQTINIEDVIMAPCNAPAYKNIIVFFSVTSPQVSISPPRLSVREGESAQFRCSASGFPAPVLQWHGGPGGRLPPEAVTSNGNGLLTFVKVKEIHEGEYFCTASNLGGISSARTFLNVSGKKLNWF